MQTSGNTLLITGGGSGIGRALAEAFHRRGNRVIVAGRRAPALEEVARANPGIETLVLDVTDPQDIARVAAKLASEYPALNALVNNAGIMQPEDWRAAEVGTGVAEATIATNLLAPIRLTAALLPLLRRQEKSTVLNVSSGLAFLPLAFTPVYSATKAAIHSFSESLRYQLAGTGVDVVEIAPPYVQTELMGEQQAADPNAMPLAAFIDEAMSILDTQPAVREVLVERVLPLRFAAGQDTDGYAAKFAGLNEHFAAR